MHGAYASIRSILRLLFIYLIAGIAIELLAAFLNWELSIWVQIALIIGIVLVRGVQSVISLIFGLGLIYVFGLATGFYNSLWVLYLGISMALALAGIVALGLVLPSFRRFGLRTFLNLKYSGEISHRITPPVQIHDENKLLLKEAQSIAAISVWEFEFATQRIRRIEGANKLNVLEDELTLTDFISRIHPEDREVMDQMWKFVNERKQGFSVELRIKRLNNEYGHFQVKGRLMCTNNEPVRMLGVIMDLSERKSAEQSLLEKEQMFLALFVSNIDPICVINASDLSIVDANPAFLKLYGFKLDELRGLPFTNLSLQPQDTLMAIEVAKQKGKHWVPNRLHKNKWGEHIHLEGSIIRHNVNGKEMLFILSHDITRRKMAENELKAREQKLSAFFDNNLLGLAESNLSKQFVNANRKLCELTGYSLEELKMLTWDKITHPADMDEALRKFNKLITHEASNFITEKRVVTKSGDEVFCRESVSAIKGATGSITHFIHLIEDISDRKAFEEELKLSQRRLKQAQTVAMIGSMWFYPNTDVVRLSDEARKILAIPSSMFNVTRRYLFKMSVPSEMGRFIDVICKLEGNERVQGNFNQTFITPRGEVKRLLLNFGLTERNGEVAEIIVTLSDITQIKEAEIALAEANALKDQLISIIGHDLRSPISALSQFSEYLSENMHSVSTSELKEVVDSLRQTATSTYKLLDDLLQWSRSQQWQDLKPDRFRISTAINDTLLLNKANAEAKGIAMLFSPIENDRVIADIEMMKAVIRNLISNAIKFTPPGGSIAISTETKSNFIEVSVFDTGMGMKPEIIGKIFDDTFIHSTPGTQNEKGFGLGLKLVKKFVERNGGVIGVESIEGQGSTFRFTIPRAFE